MPTGGTSLTRHSARCPADDDGEEELARQEKAAALEVLATSRLSVLIGAAGTGKTTLLRALSNLPEVAGGGLLLLAPTGKARVRMQDAIGRESGSTAQTLAQLLVRIDRYDGETGRYHRSDHDRISAARTVIVDESSMLTEEALDALFDGIEGFDRLILVGDPRSCRRSASAGHSSTSSSTSESSAGRSASRTSARLRRTHHPSAPGWQCGERPGRPPAGGVVRRRRAEPRRGRSVGAARRRRGPCGTISVRQWTTSERAGWAASQRARQRPTSDVAPPMTLTASSVVRRQTRPGTTSTSTSGPPRRPRTGRYCPRSGRPAGGVNRAE